MLARGVEPLLTDVEVAVSRTRPEHGGTSLVHEIELLWLAVVAGARRTLYIETQYFANRRVAEAIAARLQEPDGPEVVVLNPHEAWGWLEEKAMGSARSALLDLVQEADRYGRFRLYVPVTSSRRPIYVHAKVTVVDDRLLRIGSSNLNNRSMGLDTECDISIEVHEDSPDREALAATVLGMRDRLLGEHLDVAPEEVAAAVERAGGLADRRHRGAAPAHRAVAGALRAARPRARPDGSWPTPSSWTPSGRRTAGSGSGTRSGGGGRAARSPS